MRLVIKYNFFKFPILLQEKLFTILDILSRYSQTKKIASDIYFFTNITKTEKESLQCFNKQKS